MLKNNDKNVKVLSEMRLCFVEKCLRFLGGRFYLIDLFI